MKITSDQKVFCSIAITGEDEAAAKARMHAVVDEFAKSGIDAYCSLFDEAMAGFTKAKQFVDGTLREMQTRDVLFVITTSERRSEGQLIEIGVAYNNGMPIILVQHESAVGKSYINELAVETHVWQEADDLLEIIKKIVPSKVFA